MCNQEVFDTIKSFILPLLLQEKEMYLILQVKIELCVGDLKKFKDLWPPYMTSLVTDLPSDGSLFKNHQISKTPGFSL